MTLAECFIFLTVASSSGLSTAKSFSGVLQCKNGFIDESLEETATQIVNGMGQVVAYSTQ